MVDRCLLQDMTGGYRLHDLVLEYLQLTIKMDSGDLVEKATLRQARYLGRLNVFNGYAAVGQHARTGGLFALIALWNSVKKLNETVDAGAYYAESLTGVADVTTMQDVGNLLYLMVRSFRGIYLLAFIFVRAWTFVFVICLLMLVYWRSCTRTIAGKLSKSRDRVQRGLAGVRRTRESPR